jgi:NTP pyrophosphatase (non-canonical NTP hydrolase)
MFQKGTRPASNAVGTGTYQNKQSFFVGNGTSARIATTKTGGKRMTANDYQLAALRTAGTTNLKELLTNGVMGLAGESGECVDLVKKHLFQGHELDSNRLAKELGDVAWYLAVTSYAIGYSLDDVLKTNVEKLYTRYPDGFDPKKSINREEGDV